MIYRQKTLDASDRQTDGQSGLQSPVPASLDGTKNKDNPLSTSNLIPRVSSLKIQNFPEYRICTLLTPLTTTAVYSKIIIFALKLADIKKGFKKLGVR